MEIEIEAALLRRAAVALLGVLLLVPLGVGALVSPRDAAGRPMLLSKDLLEAMAFLEEARRIAAELEELDRRMADLAPAPAALPAPHAGATPMANPSLPPMTLLERVREVSRILSRIRDLALRLEGLPAPSGLEPARERLRTALQAFARRGTALADYLAAPTPEGWDRLAAEAAASRRALDAAREVLR